MRRCPKCKTEKPLDQFYNCAKRTGQCIYCKECSRKMHHFYNNQPEALYKKRDSQFRRKYGITIEQQTQMLENQKGLCAICGEVPKKVCVDHCHATGKVRGLLCLPCNMALGLLKDDLERIRNMEHYLVRQI